MITELTPGQILYEVQSGKCDCGQSEYEECLDDCASHLGYSVQAYYVRGVPHQRVDVTRVSDGVDLDYSDYWLKGDVFNSKADVLKHIMKQDAERAARISMLLNKAVIVLQELP